LLAEVGAAHVLPVSPLRWLERYGLGGTVAQRAADAATAGDAGSPALAPSPTTQPAAEPMTPRELDVLRLLARGMRNAQIADALFVSVGTVKWHIIHVLQKLDAHNRTEAVLHARERGLLGERPVQPST
jgi:DNA-binding NarL/FixJ family response regulator